MLGTLEENENTIEFSFENKKIEVPKTGDESKIKIYVGAIIISLIGKVYIIIKNRKMRKMRSHQKADEEEELRRNRNEIAQEKAREIPEKFRKAYLEKFLRGK